MTATQNTVWIGAEDQRDFAVTCRQCGRPALISFGIDHTPHSTVPYLTFCCEHCARMYNYGHYQRTTKPQKAKEPQP